MLSANPGPWPDRPANLSPLAMASTDNLSYDNCNEFGMIEAACCGGPTSGHLASGNMNTRDDSPLVLDIEIEPAADTGTGKP